MSFRWQTRLLMYRQPEWVTNELWERKRMRMLITTFITLPDYVYRFSSAVVTYNGFDILCISSLRSAVEAMGGVGARHSCVSVLWVLLIFFSCVLEMIYVSVKRYNDRCVRVLKYAEYFDWKVSLAYPVLNENFSLICFLCVITVNGVLIW